MDFTGRIVNLMVDYFAKRQTLMIEINEDARNLVDQLKDCEKLTITIKKFRKKRSLDANAYFHVLVGKIADVVGNSKPAVKNMLLSKYGQYAIENDTIVHLIIRDDVDVSEREDIHLATTSNTKVLDDGRLYRVYRLLRGSHTYDTREMSILIDGAVSEAKELGIETMTPDQLEEMKQRWGAKVG